MLIFTLLRLTLQQRAFEQTQWVQYNTWIMNIMTNLESLKILYRWHMVALRYYPTTSPPLPLEILYQISHAFRWPFTARTTAAKSIFRPCCLSWKGQPIELCLGVWSSHLLSTRWKSVYCKGVREATIGFITKSSSTTTCLPTTT